MKILKIIKENKKELALHILLGTFVLLALVNIFKNETLGFIENAFNFSLKHMGILALLKITSAILPFSSGIEGLLDKIFNFFFIANVLIGMELILIKLSGSLAIKLILIGLFIARFFYKKITPLLLIFLFLNPGLNIYSRFIQSLSNEINESINTKIEANINSLKNNVGMGEVEIQEEEGILSKFVDGVKAFSKDKIIAKLESIAEGLNEMLFLSIQYMLNTIFLFSLMPLIYFVVMYKIIKKL